MCAFMFMCMSTSVYMSIHFVYVYIGMCVCVYVCVCMYSCVCVCVCVCACVRACVGGWKTVSPRIVCARLKLASAGQRLAGGLCRSRDVFMSVVCMYTPTVRAPGVMMKCFYDNLQDYRVLSHPMICC